MRCFRFFAALLAAILFSCINMIYVGADSAPGIYSYKFGSTQGENGFYYCYLKDGAVYELDRYAEVNGSPRWCRAVDESLDYDGSTLLIKNDCMRPANDAAVCIKFVAPADGMVKLDGTASTIMKNTDGTAKGTARISVIKNSETIWSGIITKNQAQCTYDLMTKVKKGDSICFTADAEGSNANDLISWTPTVELLKQYKFTASMSGIVNGSDNFYYCGFGKTDHSILEYDAAVKRWKHPYADYPMVKADCMLPANAEGVGYKFKAPYKGMLKLSGAVSSEFQGGIKAQICKNDTELWSAIVKSTASVAEYNIDKLTIEKGDELYFKVFANGSNANDFTRWEPTVEYTGELFSPEFDGGIYYQKTTGGEIKQIEASINGVYIADDGVAEISSAEVRPTPDYSLIKRYNISGDEPGRYKVLAYIKPEADNLELIVSRNSSEVWRQLFLGDERGCMDIRIFCEPGDYIDIEVVGLCKAQWSCSVEEFLGTVFCKADTTKGLRHTTISSKPLGEVFMDKAVDVYSLKYGKKLPMTYDENIDTWLNTTGEKIGSLSKTAVYPGSLSDTVAEVTLKENGVMRLDGTMQVLDFCDGVVSNVYLNEELLWSSRTGGVRAVRWDEPYDVSYFLNKINVAAQVKSGDKLKLTFNRWRKSEGDRVDISDVVFSMISGNILSETTLYKLSNSIIVDEKNGSAVYDGVMLSAGVKKDDAGRFLLSEETCKRIFPGQDLCSAVSIDGITYAYADALVKNAGANLMKINDRLIVIYKGIPVAFGYAEKSEINTAHCLDALYTEMGL